MKSGYFIATPRDVSARMCWCTSGWVYWKLYHYSTRAPYSFIVIWCWYNKHKVVAVLMNALAPQEYKLKCWWWIIMFSLMYWCFQQRVVQIANSTLQSQIPSTEDQAEKEKMKAVLQQLSANMTLVNDTLNKKIQWLVDDESKNQVSLCIRFGLAVIQSLEAGPSLQFLC